MTCRDIIAAVMLVKVPAAGMFATRVRRATGMVEHNPSASLGWNFVAVSMDRNHA
jgi:hypothetical protein